MNLVVADFMVRNPVCAELWHPVGFIRQQMLANSYSYLPVFDDEHWHVVSDAAIATFLGPERNGKARTKRLASTLRDVLGSLMPAKFKFVDEIDSLADALNSLKEAPVLLVQNPMDRKGLLGILTAFDFL